MKWNTESFKQEVEKNDGYLLLSDYISCHKKVKIKHTVCNNIYEVTPTNFLSGCRCPKCSRIKANRLNAKCKRNKNITTQSFKDEIHKLFGNEFSILSDYINSKTKIKVKHNKCGNIFEILPYNLKKRGRCPKCSIKDGRNKHKLGLEELSKRIKNIPKLKDNYEILMNQEYKNNSTKIKVKHKICNNTFEITPTNLLAGKGCPFCNKKKKYNTESYQKALGENYKVLSEYKTNKDPITIQHKCGYIWTARAVDILHPSNKEKINIERCPFCNSKSLGEKKIREYLIKNNISFEEQYKFPDCKYKRALSFDFKINFNNSFILIEYDGRQHFDGNEFNHDKDNLKLQQKRDNIKNNYCKNNNIKLVRIKYTDYNNIEEILDNVIGGFKNV